MLRILDFLLRARCNIRLPALIITPRFLFFFQLLSYLIILLLDFFHLLSLIFILLLKLFNLLAIISYSIAQLRYLFIANPFRSCHCLTCHFFLIYLQSILLIMKFSYIVDIITTSSFQEFHLGFMTKRHVFS